MRGATINSPVLKNLLIDFNSHAPCGAQHSICSLAHASVYTISTHTPHAGRNTLLPLSVADFAIYFNSHAPCGAQRYPQPPFLLAGNFNSHAPCGAQQYWAAKTCRNRLTFQLTRPMRGATYRVPKQLQEKKSHFNSHAPCGAQPIDFSTAARAAISTHTPHAGRNMLTKYTASGADPDFNSHAPCGAQLSYF